jgi:hypothetical protein
MSVSFLALEFLNMRFYFWHLASEMVLKFRSWNDKYRGTHTGTCQLQARCLNNFNQTLNSQSSPDAKIYISVSLSVHL